MIEINNIIIATPIKLRKVKLPLTNSNPHNITENIIDPPNQSLRLEFSFIIQA